MRRFELEHLIRASGEIANDDEIVIVGSQSILGQFPDAPLILLASMEADIYPATKPELADKIDGAIGEGSMFHEQFGYYAQGVSPRTATLPNGWQDRLVSIRNDNTGNITGRCLDIHDLIISKLVAARPKDYEFIQEIANAGMADYETLMKRVSDTELSDAQRASITTRVGVYFASS